MSKCVYIQVNERTTEATGAEFVNAPVFRAKLEEAGKVEERRLAIIGVRDPETTSRIEQAVDWSRAKLAERFGAPGDGYEVHFHTYGRDGVMKDLEPDAPGEPHELCVIMEAISKDAGRVEEIAVLATRNHFHARRPGLKGTVGTDAIMSDEVLVGEADYRWTLNHVVEVGHGTELFTSTPMTIR